jgi:CRISPR-associated protein Cas5h
MKVVVFDVWGDYAHFRKFFTTTSPLTFPFPPPTAVRGLIGAILGIDKTLYLQELSHEVSKVSVELLSPAKKTRIGLNLLDTKDGHWLRKGPRETPRTQIRFEFVKDPRYRIYFWHEDTRLLKELRNRLSTHESFYTPYLGISECLADFKFVVSKRASLIKGKVPVKTAFKLSDLTSRLKLIEGLAIMKERMPLEMAPDRKVTKLDNVIYESSGKSLNVALKEVYSLADIGNVSFL